MATRREVIKGLAAGAASAALPFRSALAQPLTPLTLRLIWTVNGLNAAMFLALQRGWFKDAGIDLRFEDGNGSTGAVNLTGAGRFEVGEAAVSAMAVARTKGMKLRSIACFLRGTEMGVFVPKGSGLRTPKDLEGKKVIYTASSLEGPFMKAFFEAGKAEVRKVQLINVDFAAKQPAYIAGQGDALVTSIPFMSNVMEKAKPSDTIMFADYGLVLPSLGYIALEDTIRRKGPTLGAFVTVMSRAWHEVLDGGAREEAIAAILKARPQSKLDAEYLRGQIEAYRPYFHTPNTKGRPHGWQPPQDWAQSIASQKKVGLIPESMRPEEFYTNEFFAG
jgi:NitT/TauT family transport system substrate-binding protein